MTFFAHEKGPATDTENLFFALLVVKSAHRVDELNEWAKEVLEYEGAFLSGGSIPESWYASRTVPTRPKAPERVPPCWRVSTLHHHTS